MPAGSKMNPFLAKDKPISDGGSACVITELTRGKKKKNNCDETAERSETL